MKLRLKNCTTLRCLLPTSVTVSIIISISFDVTPGSYTQLPESHRKNFHAVFCVEILVSNSYIERKLAEMSMI